MSSSLDNLSIEQLRKKVGRKHKILCPPYSKWTKQQLIDHLTGNDVETDLSSIKSSKSKGLEDVADEFMGKFGHLAVEGAKQAAKAVRPKSKKSKGKKGKKPSEYNLFMKKMLPALRKEFPGKKQKDYFKLVGEAWKKQK